MRIINPPTPGYLVADEENNAIGMPRGEVLIGGPNVCAGYYVKDPENPDDADKEMMEKNASDFFEKDGYRWFRTGDVGQITALGTRSFSRKICFPSARRTIPKKFYYALHRTI